MVSPLLLEKPDLGLAIENDLDKTVSQAEDIASYHDCLVDSYLSYLKAAGYSQIPQGVHRFESGARRFLGRFPDPKLWLALSTEEQLRCDSTERGFVHYLFLRRLLPLPLTYVLSPRPHLFQMAVRLMERGTYQLYQESARRLGYHTSGAEAQFRSLLCLMIWTKKPMDGLTLDDLDAFAGELRVTFGQLAGHRRWKAVRNGLPARWDAQLRGIRKVLYHMGIFPQLNRSTRRISFEKQWERVPPKMAAAVRRYLQQLALSLRPTTAYQEKTRLFHFFSWLSRSAPEITRLEQVQRCHIEAFKEHLCHVPLQHRSNRLPGDTLAPWTRRGILSALFNFFNRLIEWQWPESPKRTLMFYQDLPVLDNALPRFLDEVKAAKFIEAARNHPDLFTQLCGVTLIMTGMRQGEFLDLTADCIVQIGGNHWLRVPLGKTHRDRFVPLNPELKQLFDEWIGQHPPRKQYDFLFTEYGHRFGRGKITLAVERVRKAAGIKERIPPHRLRHTLATLAINRGMPLESIAALLGHRSLAMTMVYARIGNRTVQQEYSQVSQHLEEICKRSKPANSKDGNQEPTLVEGKQMRRLRQDHWRMLGNGYCTRPDGVPCEYETICESCPCFSTTIEFLPILHKQKQDAQDKKQEHRTQIFDRLINSLEQAGRE